MATHSSTLAWKIPWTEEPGRLQFMGSWRVGHNWVTSLSLSCIVFTVLRQVPSRPIFWRVLIINGGWILSKAFVASIEIVIWFLSFNLLIWCMTLIDLHIIFASQEETQIDHDVWAFWCVVEFCLLKFCWGFLHLCSSVILAYGFLFFVLSLSGFGIRVMVAS